MTTIFVGSSSEAYQLASELRTALLRVWPTKPAASNAKREAPNIQLWGDRQAIAAGKYSLDGISDLIRDATLCIFLFTADDLATYRDNAVVLPRDNVILEAGISLAFHGPERTFIALQRDTKRPTDLQGVTYLGFELFDGNAGARASAIETLAQDICNSAARNNLHKVGLQETLQGSVKTAHDIGAFGDASRVKRPDGPLRLDNALCLRAYEGALSEVEHRFWTTTFLTSGFWRTNAPPVVTANEKMLERLAGKGDVRRLFLLPTSFDQFLKSEGERHAYYRRIGNEEATREMESEARDIDRYMAQMEDQGCKLRIGSDRALAAWSRLPGVVRGPDGPDNTELAIYDDFRIDVYSGSQFGVITSVQIFTESAVGFPGTLSLAEDYFETLWRSGEDARPAISRWIKNIAAWHYNIDYKPHALATYDFDLDAHDKELKKAEMQASLGLLRDDKRSGQTKRYLDVGTFTARYPIEYHGNAVLRDDAAIFGVDQDLDCISYTRDKLSSQNLSDRIRIVHADFTGELQNPLAQGEFDLITCMLGTLSHFGESGGERLKNALSNMRSLLSTEGILVIGNWSDQAREEGRFLGIYGTDERSRLKQWTTPSADMKPLLAQHGLQISVVRPAGNELDVYYCRRA